MSFVLDASMAISWLFADERTEAGQRILARAGEVDVFVPSLWRLEVANMLRNAVRRGRCDRTIADQALAGLQDLMIVVDDETDRQAWSCTWSLCHDQGLTTYDAAYLELAYRRDLPLASLDGDLVAAASRLSIAIMAA